MKAFIIFLMSNFLISCGSITYMEPEESNPQYAEPGKCYARCLIQDEVEIQTHKYYMYTGEDAADNPNVIESKVVVKGSSTKWEKKKAERNCLSANPEDCLVWCLVEVPGESYTFSEVIDTSITNSYVEKSIEVIKTIKKGGFTEWREIVCDSDRTLDLNKKIQLKLIEAGYDIPNGVSGDFGGASKAALVKYQKDNGLPVGNFNIKTMKHLGIY